MKKIVINENQRGLLFKSGKFRKVLPAGRYTLWGNRTVEVHNMDKAVNSSVSNLSRLMQNKAFADRVAFVQVPDDTVALHYVNGRFASLLPKGVHAFWSEYDSHEFVLTDITDPEVPATLPKSIFSRIPMMYYTKITVEPWRKARLYLDGVFSRLLEPGTYYFWKNGTDITAETVDTRLLALDISGQEMLTADKVTLRINFVANYRITDYVRIAEIDNYREQIRLAAQLALRRYTGRFRLDELLENKQQLADFVFRALKEKETALFVQFADAGVKDIILPGEIRDIMNTVLIAEKRARANVITRREEVASTRSLLNTARLMDENRTLYRLKELELIEKISSNVGNITLTGSGDILAQLTGLVKNRQQAD